MPDRKTHLDVAAVLLLVFLCFLWGLNQVAAKAAMPEVPPLWQAALRSLGGSGHAPAASRSSRATARCAAG